MKVKNIMFFGFAAAILSAASAQAAVTTPTYDALNGRTPNASEKNIVTSKYYVDTGVKALRDDVNAIQIPDVSALESARHTHANGTNTTYTDNDGVISINVPGVSSVDGADSAAIPTVGALTTYVSGVQSAIDSSLDDKQDMIANPTANNVATMDSTGQTINSGKAFEDSQAGLTASSDTKVPTSKAVADYMTAAHASYDSSTSGLNASTVQSAIDVVEGRLDAVETTAGSALQAADITTGTAGAHSIKVNGNDVEVSEWPVQSGVTCSSTTPCALVDDGTGTGGKIWRPMAI